jgi:hypothetical protein
VTATGWNYETLYETSFCDIADLLKYWQEEPPAHVLLALRYLGANKRGKQVNPETARQQLSDLSQFLGQPARPLPAQLKGLIRDAERMKSEHKGMECLI